MLANVTVDIPNLVELHVIGGIIVIHVHVLYVYKINISDY